LAAAKRRRVKLGTPACRRARRPRRWLPRKRRVRLREQAPRSCASWSRDARSKGCTSLRALANHLNSLDIRTSRGGTWAAASVGGSCRVGRLIQAGISHSITVITVYGHDRNSTAFQRTGANAHSQPTASVSAPLLPVVIASSSIESGCPTPELPRPLRRSARLQAKALILTEPADVAIDRAGSLRSRRRPSRKPRTPGGRFS
jgi:hypothetical protein